MQTQVELLRMNFCGSRVMRNVNEYFFFFCYFSPVSPLGEWFWWKLADIYNLQRSCPWFSSSWALPKCWKIREFVEEIWKKGFVCFVLKCKASKKGKEVHLMAGKRSLGCKFYFSLFCPVLKHSLFFMWVLPFWQVNEKQYISRALVIPYMLCSWQITVCIGSEWEGDPSVQ